MSARELADRRQRAAAVVCRTKVLGAFVPPQGLPHPINKDLNSPL